MNKNLKNLHTDAMHHLHTRMRVYKTFEPFPHPEKYKHFLDQAICIVGLLGPILTMPQLIKIWGEKNASGVSLISWSAYALISVAWVLYGLAHKSKPIVIVYSTWIIVDIIIVIGIIKYGHVGII